MKVPLVVISGPTGVGKTAAAVALAARVPVEVVSADSRQVYRGMDTATGKPTAAERAAVPHHLIDVVDPDDRYHAARFRAAARAAIPAIRARGRLPVVVGGTGLYIRALLRGLDPAPAADPAFRRDMEALMARDGRPALHARLAAAAPALARRLHPNDHVRVIRALERARAGDAPQPSEDLWRASDEFDVLHVGLTMERRALAQALHIRCAAMVDAGLLDEVRALLARGHDPTLPAMQGIGYREFARVATGDLDPASALALMRRETVRYAKRQWTWFVREPGIEWVDVQLAGGPAAVAELIVQRLRRFRSPLRREELPPA
jgi:tRNA dimethylallyltransferase